MTTLKSLLVPFQHLKADPALQPGGRGERKILVTRIRTSLEQESDSSSWRPPAGPLPWSVVSMEDTEMTYFTRDARQQRHWHQSATEIYEILEGRMQVEVDGTSHQLESGDALVVLPGAIHQVISGEDQFFARVISVHCQGAEDKFLA